MSFLTILAAVAVFAASSGTSTSATLPPAASPAATAAGTPVPANIQRLQVQATEAALRKSINGDQSAATQAYTDVVAAIVGNVLKVLLSVVAIFALFWLLPGIRAGIRQGGFNIALPAGLGTIPIPAAVKALQNAAIVPDASGLPPATSSATAPVSATMPTQAQVQAASTIRTLAAQTPNAEAFHAELTANAPALAAVLGDWAPDVDRFYGTFFHTLTLSQWTLLQKLCDGPVTSADAQALFASQAQARGSVQSFVDWLGYLRRFGMIADESGTPARISISERGRDFLAWAIATGHTQDRLLTENRYF